MSSNIYKFDQGSVTTGNSIYNVGSTNGLNGGGVISGTSGSAGILTTNDTSGYITTSINYPYNQIQYVPVQQTYDIQLRKVENGWVMLKDGKEYILKSLDEVTKYNKDSE